MVASILLYAGSIIIAAWGVAHIAPTRSVVAGFEPLSQDNRRVLLGQLFSFHHESPPIPFVATPSPDSATLVTAFTSGLVAI